jgi:sialate O-acetylesterase
MKPIFPSIFFKLFISFFITFLAIGTSPIYADVIMPHIFGDNMVLQRDRQVVVWGRATNKGEKIAVRIAGRVYRTRALEDSTWRVTLLPMQASGPYTLEIVADNKVSFRNVMYGDIWLCSGQNTMDFPLNRTIDGYKELLKAEYPMIRLFSVKKKYSHIPLEDIESEAGWQPCDIETVAHFSAISYFFAKEIFNQTKVPIGLVQATFNGSRIESWLSADVLKTFPDLKDKVELIQNNPNYLAEKKQEFEELNQKKWLEYIEVLDEGLKEGVGEGWESPNLNTKDWSEMYQPRVWSARGHELADYSGSVWFRKKFTIPTFFKGKDLMLSLGPIHDYDFTYINGKKIGQTYSETANRLYKIPQEYLKDGENEIVVFSIHFGGEGGFSGIADQVYIRSADKDDPIRYSLAGNWKFKVGFQLLNTKKIPSYPVFRGERNEPTLLYNAMIAPLHKFAIRGIIWSQGEANIGIGKARNYQELFHSLVQDWRLKWRKAGILDELPFLYTQLERHGKKSIQPSESTWAEMREVQASLSRMKNTAMAAMIDLSEGDNTLARSKNEVGRRLAAQALKMCYGRNNIIHSGPVLESVSVDGNKLKLTFKMAGNGLVAKNQYGYLEGFAIADEFGKFQWANAQITGYNTVIVYHDNIKYPAHVRYAWSDNPDVSLFNKDGFPAQPFRTDSRNLSTPPPASSATSFPDE